MRSLKLFIFILLLFVISTGAVFGQKAKAKKKKSGKPSATSSPSTPKKDMPQTQNTEFSISAETVSRTMQEKPFIFVARNKAAYDELKKIVEFSPAIDVDFSKFAVVAAFAGTQPTGGYSVSIAGQTLNDMYKGTNVKIRMISPAPDQIVTDALTSPLKVALVPVEEEKTLELEFGPQWKNSADIYRVSSGSFEFSGGFAFVQKKFEIEGTILLWRSGEFITCSFNLAGKGLAKDRKLTETATGVLSGSSFDISHLDSGGFVNNPRPPLRATGKFTGAKLVFDIKSLQTQWNDGFEGQGKLEAVKEKSL